MTPFIIAIIIILLIAIGFVARTAASRMSEPAKNPNAFLKRGRHASTKTLVVCAGDSITHGVVGANYMTMLEKQFAGAGYEFVNAGINGNLAYNVNQRLDAIIACQADIVTLLVGTNDVNATYSQKWEDQYRREQNLPEKPTLAWYHQNVELIIDRLQAETHAKIALLDLPMLGEDLDSESNAKITQYNATLQNIAEEKNITLLPLHEKLRALIPDSHSAPPYQGKIDLLGKAMMQHYLLRKSWDRISEAHGMQVLTDHIHLNDTAANIIAELISEFIRES